MPRVQLPPFQQYQPFVSSAHHDDMEPLSLSMPFGGTKHHHEPHHHYGAAAGADPAALFQRLGFGALQLETHFLSSAAVLQQQLQYHLQYHNAAISPPTTAIEPLETSYTASAAPLDLSVKTATIIEHQTIITPPSTPSPHKRTSPPSANSTPEQPLKKSKPNPDSKSPTKRSKATRKLVFDEDNSSPVSGTIIRELRPDETLVVRKGDIDPAFNVVEVTEEAKAELAKIENHIGEYVCRLCRELYEDAFGLAQHRCSRIVHVEYRCPDCDKVFNCPANLASHRRWHKPRGAAASGKNDVAKEIDIINSDGDESNPSLTQLPTTTDEQQFPCKDCGKKFRRVAYLRKHQMSVHSSSTISVTPSTTTAASATSAASLSNDASNPASVTTHTTLD